MTDDDLIELADKHGMPMHTRPGCYPWSYREKVIAFGRALVPGDDKPTYEQLELMYYAQCALADDLGEKLAAAGDSALKDRIAELEADLATMNARYVELKCGAA